MSFSRFLGPLWSTLTYPELSPADVGVPLPVGIHSDSDVDLPALPGDIDGPGVYDYIIIGGGTAGCVLASRLSEPPFSARVLLLERGPVSDTFLSRVPLISTNFARANSPNYKWEPEPVEDMPGGGETDYTMISGKVLGGTSRINSMLYTRGGPEWNRWAEEGRKGWSYDQLLPYFVKSEGALGALAGREDHGTQGRWKTRAYGHYYLPPYVKTVSAARSAGLPYIPDLNASSRPPFGCADVDVTIDAHGQRCSTFHAFLPAEVVRARGDRLSVCTQTVVRRIVLMEGRADGVIIEREEEDAEKGKCWVVRAKREIVLCAGAIGSPQVLLLSGIGPAQHLKDMGIPVVKDLPGVGSNLQDHFGASVQYRIPLRDSLHSLAQPLTLILEIIRYILLGTGILLAPVVQLSILIRSDLISPLTGLYTPCSLSSDDPLDSSNVPDIEIMPMPNSTTRAPPPPGEGAFSLLTVLATPHSRGRLRLRTLDPRARPACALNYFSSPQDWEVMRRGLALSVRLGEEMKALGYAMRDAHVPPPNPSDEELRAFVRRTARTTYHYACTCRMAPEDEDGVVDDRLRVHGVKGLRVADASVFPSIPAAHLQAPVVVVAEKCADMMKEDWADGEKNEKFF